MAKALPYLFENQSPERQEVQLTLRPRTGRPLTKAQRSFNRLVGRVEELRSQIAAETKTFDEALIYYGKHLHQRLQRQNDLQKDLVRLLAPYLYKKNLRNKNHRRILRTILSTLLSEIVFYDSGSLTGDLRAIFKQVHEIDFEKAQQQEIEVSRSEMKEMLDELGIDVDLSGLRPGMNHEELAAKLAELNATIKAEAEAAADEHSLGQRERRKSKRQLEREEQLRQTEEIQKRSIASIYKELAKALHPDLEPDADRKQHKVVLMQELTVAYRNNDLHTLLRLELEWLKREEGNLDRLTEEKLAVYNRALKDQVAELERELTSSSASSISHACGSRWSF
jgi:hypothetical protein